MRKEKAEWGGTGISHHSEQISSGSLILSVPDPKNSIKKIPLGTRIYARIYAS